MTNKHTTLAAIAFFALDVACLYFPAEKDRLEHVKNFAIFYGFISAGDGLRKKQSDSETCKNCKKQMKRSEYFLLIIALLITSLLCSCSSFRSVQIQTRADGTKTESRQ